MKQLDPLLALQTSALLQRGTCHEDATTEQLREAEIAAISALQILNGLGALKKHVVRQYPQYLLQPKQET